MDWSTTFDQHVAEYKSQVQSTLDSLAELKERALGFSESIQVHEDARDEIAECDRQTSHLLGQREGLYEDWGKANFENDALRLSEIEGEKANIDGELERLTQQRESAQKRIEDTHIDAEGISETLAATAKLKAPVLINVSTLGYSKPMPGHYAVPAFLDYLVKYHKLVEEEISAAKRAVLDMKDWTLHYDGDTYRRLTGKSFPFV